jgi:sugar phosphate isomerase/epimerase
LTLGKSLSSFRAILFPGSTEIIPLPMAVQSFLPQNQNEWRPFRPPGLFHTFESDLAQRNPVSYSIQLYTLRNALQEDLPGTIKKVAELGFTQVEPYNFVATAAALGAALKENGLTAPSGHAPLLRQDQDEIFAAAKELGITTVIDPYLPAEHWQSAEDIQATAAKLNAAAKKGAEYGIRVGYHNHAWELESSIEGRTALEYFAGLLDPELVLEVDTYWAAVGGQDPVQLLQRLGDRVKFIHIKDGPVSTDTKAQLPAGQGKIPVWDVIAAAQSLEVGVVEFDDYSGDIFDGIAQSLGYLQGGSSNEQGVNA